MKFPFCYEWMEIIVTQVAIIIIIMLFLIFMQITFSLQSNNSFYQNNFFFARTLNCILIRKPVLSLLCCFQQQNLMMDSWNVSFKIFPSLLTPIEKFFLSFHTDPWRKWYYFWMAFYGLMQLLSHSEINYWN